MNAHTIRAWFAAAIAVALLCACSEEETRPEPTPCGADEVRDATGACVPAVPTCEPDVPGSIAATCAEAKRHCFDDGVAARCTLCLDGFVEEAGACRPVKTCADLDCAAEHRSCVEGGSRVDAQCGACLPGTEGEGCVPRTCAPGVEGSIAGTCAAAMRTCVEPGDGEAHCGECYAGFVERRGVCQPVRTCEELGCVAAGRVCTPGADGEDATCGGCLPGYVAVGEACVQIPDASCDPAVGTDISGDCAAASRTCDSSVAPARCGDCEGDAVLDPVTGVCVDRVRCEDLNCAAENRACEPVPNGHCTTCLPGFTEDPATRSCRPVRTCAQITCGSGEMCIAAGDHEDARCAPDCGADAIWSGSRCEPCPPCDDVGEDGRWATPTKAGACICRTEPGYFYSTAGDVGSFACDADGDGWVRESARLALESNDPAIRANARCELRTIDRVILVNEAGERRTVMLQMPLPLYESDRNDDDTLLAITWQVKGLPAYGADGSIPSARELNRMTKLCHDPRTDYNDNGVPDVDEWMGHPRAPTVRPEQAPFNQFSYFVELHTGRYLPPGPGDAHGAWEIVEKSRLRPTSPEDRTAHVQIAYPAEDGSYWRECDVDRDPRYGVLPVAVGLDFAVHSDPAPGWSGMNHHSQFKCMVFENEPMPELPQQITPAEAAVRGYRLNRCRATGPAVEPDEINPALTDLECEPVAPNAVAPGDVAWAAVPYVDYGPHIPGSSYRGGCVNDCILQYPLCPGYDINPEAVTCTHDPLDFGRFVSCDAFEVCDGFDNDFDGIADDGNPGSGLACETGEEGVCSEGTTNCRDGAIACDRNVQPSTERCNGVDDDCDGEVDESFPEANGACTVPGLQGECAKGVYVCEDGGLRCLQVNEPVNEACNGLDDDCDGQVDEGENATNCITYYFDEDGDGWGYQAASKCLCRPQGNYTALPRHYDGTHGKEPFAFDCCDRDSAVRPGATDWHTTASECGSFDYNCDGVETKQHNTAVAPGCGTCCFLGFCCCDPRVGWANSVPNCGQNATWYTDECSTWSSCEQQGYQATMACR